MKSYKIKGNEKMDFDIRNTTWTWEDWDKWAVQRRCGLILEDGKVKGYDTEPERHHV